MQSDLFMLIHYQKQLVNVDLSINEFEIIHKFQNAPTKKLRERASLAFFKKLENNYEEGSKQERIKVSNKFREEGNKLFTAKGKERDLLGACRYYTKAIFAAPLGSEALALAHANRAMSLQEFGYFPQAYDDCVCALEQGYPERMSHKLVTRQAFCALKLKDAVLLKRHLDALDKMTLNSNFAKQKEELLSDFEKLTLAQETIKDEDEHEVPLVHDKQKVVDTNGPKGRCVIATGAFKKNELIFGERATSFVPVNNWRICQYCAHTQLIPFPCYKCYGRVVYCSIKCRNKHAKVHEFECPGYRLKFLEKIDVCHLATLIVFENLPSVMPDLVEKRTAKEMWAELVEHGSIYNNQSLDYSKTLRMVTHLFKKSHDLIVEMALTADLIVFYLKQYTKFFVTFPINRVNRGAWETLIGALILRHIGQLWVNIFPCNSLTLEPNKLKNPLDFVLTVDDTWAGPYRVKLGHLYIFSTHNKLAIMNCQYPTYFNHACEEMFQSRFSGRYMAGYATRDIKANEEIFCCYLLDYRKSKFQFRRDILQQNLMFTCECAKCVESKPNEEYEKYHRYRCDNPRCGKEFVPNLYNTLTWWRTYNPEKGVEPINCSVCGVQQKMLWINKLAELCKNTENPINRRALYKIYASLDKWLLGYNEFKVHLSLKIIYGCYVANSGGLFLEDDEFATLSQILKYCLSVQAAQCRINSLEYISKMTYLWDFIALGKVKCSHDEMQPMLEAIEILSNEDKRIFLNYYEDYIKEKLQ